MKKTKLTFTLFSLISVLARSACHKGDSSATIEPSENNSTLPEISNRPSEKPQESASEKPGSNSDKPSTSTSEPPKTDAIKTALNADYSNSSLSVSAVSEEVGSTTDSLFYYNNYQILVSDWGTGDKIYQYYHDYNGKSYQWFEASKGSKEVSSWLNQGSDGAYVGIGGQGGLDFRRVIEKLKLYQDKIILRDGEYYIVDETALEDIMDYCYSWCRDVSADTFYFKLDSNNLLKEFGIADSNVDTDVNSAITKVRNVGGTTFDDTRLPAAPNADNVKEYWQYKGYDGPQVHVYIKSIDLTVSDDSAKKDGDTYILDIEKSLPRTRSRTWDAPDGVKEERWIKESSTLTKVSDDPTVATFESTTTNLLVLAQSQGETKVYYSWKDGSGNTHTSNKISIRVNGLPSQNLKDAVYNLSFNGLVNQDVSAVNSISNSLPFGVSINKGCDILDGQGIYKGKKVLRRRNGSSNTRQEERDTRGDGVATFDFSDQQVSGISFYYAQRYSNNETSAIEKVAIETSNDGSTWTELDITEEVKDNVSTKNLKLREKTFAPAYKVRIHIYGNRIGKQWGFSTEKVAFIADENCHKHYQADAEPVTGVRIAAEENASSVSIGKTLQFSSVITPNTATNKELEWHVSDAEKASIDNKGLLTPLKTGMVEVYALSRHGATETPIESNHVQIEIKEAEKVSADIIGQWWDKEDRVITITKDEAKIDFKSDKGISNTVTLPYSGKSENYDVFGTFTDNRTAGFLKIKKNFSFDGQAEYVLNVVGDKGDKKQANLYSATDELYTYIKATKIEIGIAEDGNTYAGKEAKVEAFFSDEEGNDAAEEAWKLSSADQAIVQVEDDEGTFGQESSLTKGNKTIKCLKTGKTTLTATSSTGLTADLDVEVTPVRIDSIKITLDKTTLVVGETAKANTKITPADAANTKLKWSTNDKTVATVDQNGTITAVKAGEATITAEATDGSFASDEVTITVIDKPSAGDIGSRAGTYEGADSLVTLTITADGTVTLTDYNSSIEDDELAQVSYDGTTYIGTSLDEGDVTLKFNADGTVTYTYTGYDPVTLTKTA